MLDSAAAAFQSFKLMLVDAAGLSRDALHIHFGMVALLLGRLVWRWRAGWLVAWLVALTVALMGEVFDWRSQQLSGGIVPLQAHWHDIWNTMLWPTIVSIIGWRLEQRGGSGQDAEEPLEQA